MSTLNNRCKECGAKLADGLTCFDQFGVVLSWEAFDEELLALHFWTVASYNLQHPSQFTELAISGLREVFIEAFDKDLPIAFIRKKVSKLTEGKTKVIKTEQDAPVFKKWSVTISDIYDRGNHAGAAERVVNWRRTVREEI